MSVFDSGMFCDDISFCPDDRCTNTACPRNQKNIRDHTIPHSYFMELPADCPLYKEATTDEECPDVDIEKVKEIIETFEQCVDNEHCEEAACMYFVKPDKLKHLIRYVKYKIVHDT